MLNRTQKQAVSASLSTLLKTAQGFVLVNYHGLTMKEITELKTRARAAGVKFKTAKKTLLKRALQQSGVKGIDPTKIEGDLSLALSDTDAVAPIKLMYALSRVWKRTDVLKVGLLSGTLFESDALQKIATLPSLEVLRAQLLSAMIGPARGLVMVLNGVTSKFVRTVDAIRDSKQK